MKNLAKVNASGVHLDTTVMLAPSHICSLLVLKAIIVLLELKMLISLSVSMARTTPLSELKGQMHVLLALRESIVRVAVSLSRQVTAVKAGTVVVVLTSQ
jgi:hypothetical protein